MAASGGSARSVSAILAALVAIGGCSSGSDSRATAPSSSSSTVPTGGDTYPAGASVDDKVELWWQRHRGEVEAVDTAVNDLRATAMFRSDPAAIGDSCNRLATAAAALRDDAVPAPEPRLTAALEAWVVRLEATVSACTSVATDPADRVAVEALIADLDAGEDEAERTVTPVLDAYLHESG